ncbi:MAG: DNA polymerase III subunit gamma/tau [Bacillota bacterium]|nr:DNA polymerase III subunit gamma/tau [Bacillota bacterium]
MYTALYREYRPEVFDEILGQEHIVRILKNQIDTDSTSHAYLFCGTRGTGKTTTARILAKGLNCLSEGSRPCGSCSACRAIKEGTYLDVMEIDAASNNGVDNIRELRESVKYPPAVGRKKVYIIDEVHMLSSGAFNALLKTLEEPPEYVVFILATTEPQKLPSTILSRCMRLDFKRVPETLLMEGMRDICTRKGIEVTDGALRIIAANADGSVRDGLSILDQCISGGDLRIDTDDVLEFLGASGEETFVELTELVRKGRTADALVLLGQVLADGKDVRQFMRDWVNHYRNLLMTKFIREPQSVINMSVENIDRIRRQSEATDLADINRGILELSRTMNEAKWSTQPRILLELAIVQMSSNLDRKEPEQNSVQEKIETAEKPKAPVADNQWDCEKIWNAVFQDGEAAKGSFYIIGSSAALTEISDNTFTVAVKSEHVRMHAEKNRSLLEDLMEKHTGGRRTMKLVMNGEGEEVEGSRSVEEIAHDAEELLGINVEIQ